MRGYFWRNKFKFFWILISIIYSLNVGCANTVKVMDCAMNGLKNTYAGIWKSSGFEFRPLQPFTVCIRLQFANLKLHNVLVHMNDTGTRPTLQLSVYVDKLKVAVAHEYKYAMLEKWLEPNSWYHVCITNDPTKENGIAIYLNGKIVATHSLKLKADAIGKFVSVGFFDPNFYPGLSFVGNLSSFNIWSRLLSEPELKNLATCKKDMDGDIISWNDVWSSQNITFFDLDINNLCEQELSVTTELLHPIDFYEAAFVCEGIGGELITPNTLSQGQELVTWARDNFQKCNVYWIGIWDEQREGRWVYHKSKVPSEGLPWAPDEPNGLHFENCGGVDYEGLIDDNCNSIRCPFCAVRSSTPWTLYGSCELKTHDMNFILQIQNDTWRFFGYGDYIIYKEDIHWVWKKVATNQLIASLNSSFYNYPIGRQIWNVHRPICQQTEGLRTLLLSTCGRDEFSCDDGNCIPQGYRCDLKYDCADTSDESNCTLFRLPVDYKTKVAPRVQGVLNSSNSLPISTNVLLETIRVDTNNMLLQVSFNLSLSWNEDRATYVNLKRDFTLNVLDSERNVLWSPSLAFVNTEDDSGTVVDKQTSSYLHFQNPSIMKDLSIPEGVILFEGFENMIVSYRKYRISFTCDFDLSRYPFDTQMCFMDLRLRYDTLQGVHFKEDSCSASYEGNKFLIEYFIGNVHLKIYEFGGYSGVKIFVPLRRLHGYAFINIYLPTLTMLIIGYLTLLFQINIFEVRIMTALTSLLVMATLFTQIAASLPKTSYFKMVDIWFLFCIFYCFFIIVFHIIIDAIEDPQDGMMSNKTNVIRIHPISSKEKKKNKSSSLFPSWFDKKQCLYATATWTPKGMRKFASICMLIVFILFNIPYWSAIYGEVNLL